MDSELQKAIERLKRLEMIRDNAGYNTEVDKLRNELVTRYGELIDKLGEFRVSVLEQLAEDELRLDTMQGLLQTANQRFIAIEARLTALENP